MVALVLCISGLLLLTVGRPISAYLGLEKLVATYGGLIGVVVTVSFVVLVFQIGIYLWNVIQQRTNASRRKQKALGDLRTLSQEEQAVIKYCVEQRRRSIPGRNTWDIVALVEKGLLEVANGQTLGQKATPCTIPEHIWNYLMEKCGGSAGNFHFP